MSKVHLEGLGEREVVGFVQGKGGNFMRKVQKIGADL